MSNISLLRRTAIGAVTAAVVAVPAITGIADGATAHKASTPSLQTKKTSVGNAIVASNGHALYSYSKDGKNQDMGSGPCARTWKPYTISGKVSVSSSLKANLAKTIKISGGKNQVTYNGHPLYTYSKDRKGGDLKGQAAHQFGGDWYVVGSKGSTITCEPDVACGY